MPRPKPLFLLLAAAVLTGGPVLAAGMAGMAMPAPSTGKPAGKPPTGKPPAGRPSPAVRALTLSGGWVAATPPGADEAAAYLTLSNPGQMAVTLVGASSLQAGGALLMLTTKDRAGRLTMQGTQHLVIPAGGTLTFAPERAHVMLMGPAPLRPGDTLTLQLRFSDGSIRPVTLKVRPL